MRRALAKAAAAGALVGAALFALDFAGGEVGFMGMRDPRVIAEVVARARAHAIADQLLMLAVLAGACAAFGAIAALVGGAWDGAAGRAPRRPWLRGVAGALVGHAWFMARSMAQFPQLYSAHYYERGGVRRAAMMLVTDRLTPGALDVALALGLTLALAWPLRSPAARAWLRRRARPLAVAAVVVVTLAAWDAIGARPHRLPATAKPSVLLVAVDSLRADRVFAPTPPRASPRWRRWRRAACASARRSSRRRAPSRRSSRS